MVGTGLSRFEGDFRPSGDAPLSIAELLAILDRHSAGGEHERQQAIACFLSASEGWRDAVKALGGAFASDGGGTRLKDGQLE